ncbi:MAG: HNH endonuclease [Defluviitaleaceae bacterium]|nr:HNH endonuclease [Defluviitaleaceae bacterium]
MYGRKYSDEEREFLIAHIPGRSFETTAQLFNSVFCVSYPEMGDDPPRPPISAEQVKGFAGRYGVQTGRDTKFKKGQISHNKGKYVRYSRETEFKKGHMPHNHKPVGSTRITVDGYTEVKIAEPKKWRMLHVHIWEQANGAVPKGHVLIFGDGNRQNITLDNLLLVTRAQLARLNQQKLIGATVELTKIGILTADLISKVSEKKNKLKKRRVKKST